MNLSPSTRRSMAANESKMKSLSRIVSSKKTQQRSRSLFAMKFGPAGVVKDWVKKYFQPLMRQALSQPLELNYEEVSYFVFLAQSLTERIKELNDDYDQIIDAVEENIETLVQGSIYLVNFLGEPSINDALVDYLEACYDTVYVYPIIAISVVAAVIQLGKNEEFLSVLETDAGIKLDQFFETAEYGYMGCTNKTEDTYCKFLDPKRYLQLKTGLIAHFYGNRLMSMRRKSGRKSASRKLSMRRKHSRKASRKSVRKSSRKNSRKHSRKFSMRRRKHSRKASRKASKRKH